MMASVVLYPYALCTDIFIRYDANISVDAGTRLADARDMIRSEVYCACDESPLPSLEGFEEGISTSLESRAAVDSFPTGNHLPNDVVYRRWKRKPPLIALSHAEVRACVRTSRENVDHDRYQAPAGTRFGSNASTCFGALALPSPLRPS